MKTVTLTHGPMRRPHVADNPCRPSPEALAEQYAAIIDPPRTPAAPLTRVTRQERADIRWMRRRGWTLDEIVQRTGRALNTVMNCCRGIDVDRRRAKGAM